MKRCYYTQQAFENSLRCYVSLREFASVGYLTLSANNKIIGANLLGEKRASLLGQRLPKFIAPEDGNLWHQHFYRTMQHRINKSCEVRIRGTNDTQFFCEARLPINTINHIYRI
jgi:hypothetical protein